MNHGIGGRIARAPRSGAARSRHALRSSTVRACGGRNGEDSRDNVQDRIRRAGGNPRPPKRHGPHVYIARCGGAAFAPARSRRARGVGPHFSRRSPASAELLLGDGDWRRRSADRREQAFHGGAGRRPTRHDDRFGLVAGHGFRDRMVARQPRDPRRLPGPRPEPSARSSSGLSRRRSRSAHTGLRGCQAESGSHRF